VIFIDDMGGYILCRLPRFTFRMGWDNADQRLWGSFGGSLTAFGVKVTWRLG
jgi:hypothetical protein